MIAQARLFASGLGNFGLEELHELQKVEVYLSASLQVKQMLGASEEDLHRVQSALDAACKAESDPDLLETIVCGLRSEIKERVRFARF